MAALHYLKELTGKMGLDYLHVVTGQGKTGSC